MSVSQSWNFAPTPSPTYDPLATPVMPEHPTQLDIGRMLYYHHCMPCHGDKGQGLTDEFRMVWVEDHRNCWGRGCHGGRPKDEGFPIPTFIPAVMGDEDAIPEFTNPQALWNYLRLTHPPQEPGRLSEDEYWALVALLWESNGKPGSPEDYNPVAGSVPLNSTAVPSPTPTHFAPLPSVTPKSTRVQSVASKFHWQGGLALVILLLLPVVLIIAFRKRG